jgi:hypothetical protein
MRTVQEDKEKANESIFCGKYALTQKEARERVYRARETPLYGRNGSRAGIIVVV